MYDVCIIGAGVEGSATAFYLASRRKRTLLLEQFPQPHTRGSSHGHTRIVRYGYSQEFMTKMMPEAFRMWQEIEKASGISLVKKVGALFMQGSPHDVIRSIERGMKSVGGAYELLSAKEIKERYPGIVLPSEFAGLLDLEGGFILATCAVRAMQDQFVKFGGILRDSEKVVAVEPGHVVKITTTKGSYHARHVIMTPGPWANEALSLVGLSLPLQVVKTVDAWIVAAVVDLQEKLEDDVLPNNEADWKLRGHLTFALRLQRVSVCYWEVENPERFTVDSGFPCILLHGERLYGSPIYEYPGLIKICRHEGVEVVSPDSRDVQSARHNDTYIRRASESIQKYLTGIKPQPSIVETCMYTVTPDHQFILDRHPSFPNIVIGAGFSGHGFKVAPLIGKLLSQLALGEETRYDLSHFRISRFGNTPGVKCSL